MNVKNLFDLSGRVAIITGGYVGLGRQMAEGLAEMGAKLVLCARKKERCIPPPPPLNPPALHLPAPGRHAHTPPTIQQPADATIKQLAPIDLLIHNPGTSSRAP